MDINFLFDYVNPLILGICLLLGFCLKTAFDWFPNKYIPLTALCMDFNPRSCEGSDDTGISQSTIST